MHNQIITPSTNNLKNGMAASGMAQPAPPLQKRINSKTKYNVSRTSIFWLHNPTIAPSTCSLKNGMATSGMVQPPPPPSKSNKFYKLTVIKLQTPTFIFIGMYYPSYIPPPQKKSPPPPSGMAQCPPP